MITTKDGPDYYTGPVPDGWGVHDNKVFLLVWNIKMDLKHIINFCLLAMVSENDYDSTICQFDIW